jgi:patatin-like phospholipase/acyl hydrolase
MTGGGFLGYFTVSMLDELETLHSNRIANCTDLYVGTSIGGILSLGLAAGKTPAELKKAFILHKDEIFSGLGWRMAFTRYRKKGLKNAITKILGADIVNLSISDLPKPVIVTAVKYDTAESVLISSFNEYSDWKVIDAALATSAAPTYFPAHKVAGVRYIDGGMSANVPDMATLNYVIKKKAVQRLSVRMLSVGTTYTKPGKVKYKTMGNFAGGLRWATKMVPFVMDAQRNLMYMQCKYSFTTGQYYRLDQSIDKNLELDDTSEDTISTLSDAVTSCIKKHGKRPEIIAYFA